MTGDKTRRRRWLWAAAGLIAVQGVAAALYVVVERGRAGDEEPISFEPLDEPLSPVVLERPGERLALPADDSLTLLHLWATWCAPCREELPSLLALEESGFRLLAASTDESWRVVRHYFDEKPPAAVWRIGRGREELPVQTLPTTIVLRGDRIVGRMEGARAWTARGVQALRRTLLEKGR